MTKPIYVLNGPNLNRLGTREPHLYGSTTLAEVEAMCREAVGHGTLEFRQSNREYELIDWIHEAIDEGGAIVINPAAFTFTSMAILDALKCSRVRSSNSTSPTSTVASRSTTAPMFHSWQQR